MSRSYYRGAAGAILVYDICNYATFRSLPTFLDDAKALASPHLSIILAGNKADLVADDEDQDQFSLIDTSIPSTPTQSSFGGRMSALPTPSQGSLVSSSSARDSIGLGNKSTATVAPEGREVLPEEASRWASTQGVPVAVEVSALSGANIDELFTRLAGMILTKIELGEINPDDPQSGIQYGDSGTWGSSDGASIKSSLTVDDGYSSLRRRGRRTNQGRWVSGLREWEEVFRLDGRRRNRCC